MSSHNARGELAYNGECYNHKEIAASLGLANLRTQSDTEVLVEAFTLRGVADTLPLVRGMFALAFLDRESATLWLARDRFGEKPLYLYSDATQVLFCSELGPLVSAMRILGCDIRPDLDAISLYLTLGYIPAPFSLVKGVSKLAPAELVGILRSPRGGGFEIKRQPWSPPWRVEPSPGQRIPLSELDLALQSAVAEQLVADVPVGIFLSGGIDSSLVAWNAVRLGHAGIETFSVGFQEESLDESPHAAAVARALGTRHHNRIMTSTDALEMLALMDVAHSEPLGDPSSLPTMFVSKLAHEHVTVALSGDGGDELFGGYGRYGTYSSWNSGLRSRALRILGGLPNLDESRVAGMAASLVMSPSRLRRAQEMGRMGSVERYLALVGHAHESSDLGLRDESLDGSKCFLASIWEQSPSGGIDGLRDFDVATYLPGDILAKVDRAAMTFSLETRAPFLDARVASLAAKMPEATLWRDGQGKKPLRQLSSRMKAGIEGRPKAGFGPPVGAWLRGSLKPWADSVVSDEGAAVACGLDPLKVGYGWSRFISGVTANSYSWWAILRLMHSVRSLGLEMS